MTFGAGLNVVVAFPTETLEEWVRAVAAVYGNRSQVNAVERAGAAAWRGVARENVDNTTEGTGRLRKTIRTYRSKQGGMGVRVNKKGDYSKTGDGVRHGTVVHQGRDANAPFSPRLFFYLPNDPEDEIVSAMKAKMTEQVKVVGQRAQALLGRLGSIAQQEIEEKITKGTARFKGHGGPQGPFGRRAEAETQKFLATLADHTIDDDRELPGLGRAF